MANRLKEWRERQEPKLTQRQFGEQIGVTQQAVDKYESGERMPEPDVMVAIFEATGGAVGPADFYALPQIPATTELPRRAESEPARAPADSSP